MTGLNLSNIRFSNNADIVNPNSEIFNPLGKIVNTLAGDDQIIGTGYLTGDFALGAFVGIAAQNIGAIGSSSLSGKASVAVYGIKNQGILYTSDGNDIVKGTARTNISVSAQTVSQVIAYANSADTVAIAKAFASINLNATSDGIDNSRGLISTGKGSDAVSGSDNSGIAAVAIATVDATSIVEAIAKAPLSAGLTAFAQGIAQSLAVASITATGIKNIHGIITTGNDNDGLSASATSSAATFAGSYAATLASASPGNQALAQGVASAIAQANDQAIAINNTKGIIDTGSGNDRIEATAQANDKAIAILNTTGLIRTGDGDDTIIAKATGSESFGIFGGLIETGLGNDQIIASSFGGGVNINTGDGRDFVQGFGNARINGGFGSDTLSLGSFNKTDFNISFGANNSVIFQRDGQTLTAIGVERFEFANNTDVWTI